MRETFEQYLQRLKDRRTEDDYKYTDEDFKKYIYYIFDCYEKGMSVYKCLEFMYFAERDMDDQLFNREFKQEIIASEEDAKIFIDTMIQAPEPNEKLKKAFREYGKQETLEEAVDRASLLEFPIKEWYRSDDYSREEIKAARDGFKRGAKWYQEQHDLLPGFIKQFDPKEGEINGEEWTAVHFIKWLELNKFKIVK
jgi:hypothetical protein